MITQVYRSKVNLLGGGVLPPCMQPMAMLINPFAVSLRGGGLQLVEWKYFDALSWLKMTKSYVQIKVQGILETPSPKK